MSPSAAGCLLWLIVHSYVFTETRMDSKKKNPISENGEIGFFVVMKKSMSSARVGAVSCVCEYTESVTSKAE